MPLRVAVPFPSSLLSRRKISSLLRLSYALGLLPLDPLDPPGPLGPLPPYEEPEAFTQPPDHHPSSLRSTGSFFNLA